MSSEIIENQITEQYLSIGKFVVHFEHLFFAMKLKVTQLCGGGEETRLLLEPYSVRNTIETLENLIKIKIGKKTISDKDKVLYKALIKDLINLNTKRNGIIHTTWFIGWRSDNDTDVSEFQGSKFTSALNQKFKTYTAEEINTITEECKILYSVFFTLWSIDNFSFENFELNQMWERTEKGWLEVKK